MNKDQLSNNDIMRFLQLAYFGNIDEPYYAAGDRAYRDFCRTIDFTSIKNKLTRQEQLQKYIERQTVKSKIYDWLRKELLSINCSSKDDFDSWHDSACKKIIKDFSKEAKLYYGQAQKWLNMTLKYLLVLDISEAKQHISYLHVPIDNIVLQTVSEHIKLSKKPWSRWEESDYKNFQNKLNLFIHKTNPDIPPILWEFRIWIPTDMFNN